jgi:hypothetical protein
MQKTNYQFEKRKKDIAKKKKKEEKKQRKLEKSHAVNNENPETAAGETESHTETDVDPERRP